MQIEKNKAPTLKGHFSTITQKRVPLRKCKNTFVEGGSQKSNPAARQPPREVGEQKLLFTQSIAQIC